MVCSNCGTDNEAGRKFCMECGTALAVLCPTCGAPNPQAAKFCGDCGSSLPGAAPSATVPGLATVQPRPAPATVTEAERSAPGAERRLVSILFADLVGFTPLSEVRDAEEVRELLSSYFEVARRVVSLYGGTIEKFIGDAVMAVWGTPTAQEDDAERAVRAALDLTAAVATLGSEVGAPDLMARAGVLTGEAAVTVGAEGQGMVAGDLVNTAARIQAEADPGTVLVGASTRRATEAAIAYEDAGPHRLKGKAEPVPLHRALRVVAGVRGAQRSAGLEPPFVGRDREFRLLKELFHVTVGEGTAQLVSVVGVAGIGKSRLAWEFFKYIDGLSDFAFWHRGRCLAYGEGVTYFALAEMVRGRAGILEGEDQASAREKLAAAVEQYVPDPEERRWTLPSLAHLIGIEERQATEREELFGAWRRFFERLAERYPVVMVFEDMQWADPSLLDFIEYLLDWSRSHPIYILVHGRPELSERRPSWGVGRRSSTSLHLEPLAPEAMEALLAGLVPGLPGDLRARILERAAGVPLYAVETVRMLLDRDLLVQEGNGYRPAGPIEALEVPETLHALIAARLDGLTPEERRLVQDASVLGKTFTRAGVASITGMGEDAVEPLLSSLVRKEVLGVQADPRSPERGQYGFLQDLVQRVAYETLSKKERKARHLAVATFLERTVGREEEDVVEVAASHYLAAYDLAPDAPDAADIRATALDRLASAADRAASLAATAEAQRYFEQAVGLADDALRQAELLERAGLMAWIGGRVEASRGHLERAEGILVEGGHRRAAARVSAHIATLDFHEGHAGAAVERMRSAHAVLAEQEEPDADLATVAAQLARFLSLSGRHEEAREPTELALELAETLELPEVFANALNTRALTLMPRNRLEEATVLVRHALDVALRNGLIDVALRSYNNLLVVLDMQDRQKESLEVTERALELTRRVGARGAELSFLAGQMSLQVFSGLWDDALRTARAIGGVEEVGSLPAFIRLNLIDMTAIHARRGDLEEARRWLERVGPEDADDPQGIAGVAVNEAVLLRMEGRNAKALERSETALAYLGELGVNHWSMKQSLVEGMDAALALRDAAKAEEILSIVERLRPGELTPYLRGHGARFAARIAAARGQDDAVESGFRVATETFREGSFLFSMAEVLLEHAEWLAGRGRADQAGPLLHEAREIFERLGARPYLDRLDALTRSEAPTGAVTG
ncbi:MAG: AAA family ATPase [Actinobacteria bacterium]|nr:AAA family ATPase [Actinomycetota bacterium]